MDIGVYSISEISNEKIKGFVDLKKSFVLENIARTNIGEAAERVEKIIESKGLKCRIYMKGRSAALAAQLAVPVVGWAAAAAMGVHNLVTWDPDYEIGKNIAMGTLTITYKK